MNIFKTRILLICSLLLTLSACKGSNDESMTQLLTPKPETEAARFALNFKATNGGLDVNCDNINTGLGRDGAYSVSVTDMRFYVSKLKFFDANGQQIPLTLDDNPFQLNHEAGAVSLIDFTDSESGHCALAQEGTPRTNTQIGGTVEAGTIAAVSFDVGVPQAVMKAAIAATDDVTDTPSPLGEMYWSWASGYRHFVMNFIASDATHTDRVENSGFHIGSRGCGNAGDPKALSDKDTCSLLNTPSVLLENFNPDTNVITVDLRAIFANTQSRDFVSDVWSDFENDESLCLDGRRRENSCVTGQNFGIQCHSTATQTPCVSMFPNFGLHLESGAQASNTNTVFGME